MLTLKQYVVKRARRALGIDGDLADIEKSYRHAGRHREYVHDCVKDHWRRGREFLKVYNEHLGRAHKERESLRERIHELERAESMRMAACEESVKTLGLVSKKLKDLECSVSAIDGDAVNDLRVAIGQLQAQVDDNSNRISRSSR